MSTLAGSSAGLNDGMGSKVKFSNPYGLVFNRFDDCLYVCDRSNNMIRKVTQLGIHF